MTDTARCRIAERVKNAYAAGHNDGRKGRLPDRMDEVADTETGNILEIVLLVLMEQPNGYKTYRTAFGADDDGGERGMSERRDALPESTVIGYCDVNKIGELDEQMIWDSLDPMHREVVGVIFSGIDWKTREVKVRAVSSVIEKIRSDERRRIEEGQDK